MCCTSKSCQEREKVKCQSVAHRPSPRERGCGSICALCGDKNHEAQVNKVNGDLLEHINGKNLPVVHSNADENRGENGGCRRIDDDDEMPTQRWMDFLRLSPLINKVSYPFVA